MKKKKVLLKFKEGKDALGEVIRLGVYAKLRAEVQNRRIALLIFREGERFLMPLCEKLEDGTHFWQVIQVPATAEGVDQLEEYLKLFQQRFPLKIMEGGPTLD